MSWIVFCRIRWKSIGSSAAACRVLFDKLHHRILDDVQRARRRDGEFRVLERAALDIGEKRRISCCVGQNLSLGVGDYRALNATKPGQHPRRSKMFLTSTHPAVACRRFTGTAKSERRPHPTGDTIA
jgi:hypothetical protein